APTNFFNRHLLRWDPSLSGQHLSGRLLRLTHRVKESDRAEARANRKQQESEGNESRAHRVAKLELRHECDFLPFKHRQAITALSAQSIPQKLKRLGTGKSLLPSRACVGEAPMRRLLGRQSNSVLKRELCRFRSRMCACAAGDSP